MISESLSYPRNDENWLKTALVGGVLSFLGFLIVPTFLVIGYLLRVVRVTMKGDEQLPVLDDWGGMVANGVKGFVIASVYGVLPLIIMSVSVGSTIIGIFAGDGSDTAGIPGDIMTLVGLLVSLAPDLLAAYIVPAALVNHAETDRLGSAFDVGALRPVLTSGKHVTARLTAFVVLFVVSVVLSLLNIIPLLGQLLSFVLGPFVGFYAAVAAYYIIGQTRGKLHEVEMMDEGEISGEQLAIWEQISTLFRLF